MSVAMVQTQPIPVREYRCYCGWLRRGKIGVYKPKAGQCVTTPGATRMELAAVPQKRTTLLVRRECLTCGAVFHVTDSYLAKGENYGLYCSPRCRGIHRRQRITVECGRCGKPFETTAVFIQRGRRYCSRECMGNYQPSVEATCSQCGTVYRQFASRMVYGQTFCSNACRLAHVEANRGDAACQWCGKTFPAPPSMNRRYCSKRCYGQAMTDHDRVDRKSWRYRHWRRAVLSRDGHQCQRCGSKSDLHAHHIKRWSKSPELRFDVDNGVTLCASCHAKEEPWLNHMWK